MWLSCYSHLIISYQYANVVDSWRFYLLTMYLRLRIYESHSHNHVLVTNVHTLRTRYFSFIECLWVIMNSIYECSKFFWFVIWMHPMSQISNVSLGTKLPQHVFHCMYYVLLQLDICNKKIKISVRLFNQKQLRHL